MLKKKFRQPTLDLSSPTLSFSGFPASPIQTPDLATPTSPLREPFGTATGTPTSPLREPPPYRPPPVASLSPIGNTSSPIRRFSQEPPVGLPLGIPIVEPVVQESVSTVATRLSEIQGEASSPVSSPPVVPPRRKSQDKIKLANKENQSAEKVKNGSEPIKVSKLNNSVYRKDVQ